MREGERGRERGREGGGGDHIKSSVYYIYTHLDPTIFGMSFRDSESVI